MFILTFVSIVLIFSHGKARRVIDGFNADGNNWDPFLFVSKDLDESPNYDITRWVRQLHLQQCAFVEIGEGFCALFVELRNIPSESEILDNSGVGEFFLGICHCLTLHSWDLCPFELTRQRKVDCTFVEATPYSNTSARVHRRLCDVTSLGENAPSCNCSISLAGHRLYETKGFPTCFLNPLPESLCSPRGVCGVAQCSATTIKGIHTPQCASNCHQRQPFCEEIGPWTSIPAEITSLWSRWSSPKCNNTCGGGFVVAIASCQDQGEASHRLYRARIILVSFSEEVPSNSQSVTKGVNFSSCPNGFGKCYCEVNTVDGIMRAARFTEPCISTEGCIPSNVETFTFEGEPDSSNSVDSKEVYENYDRERFEDTLRYSESARPSLRRLLRARRLDEYGLRENRPSNKKLRNTRVYRSVPRSRSDDDADYDDKDEDDEEGDNDESGPGDEGGDKADEDEEEEDEETIDLRGFGKGRWSPRKRAREARSDYAAIAFEGKQEVDEPERNGAMEIGSVTDDCDDDSTEPLQYYDYDSGGSSISNSWISFATELVIVNILLRLAGV